MQYQEYALKKYSACVQDRNERGFISRTKALKPKFVLQQMVKNIGVLACIGIIDLVVRTHDASDTSTDSISEGPMIQ